MSSKETSKKLDNNGRVLILFSINVAVMLLCIMYLHPAPMNNDDMIIHFITSGVFGEASPGLATSNIVLGYLLSLPSRILSTVNWVTIYEYLLLFLAFTVGSSIIWSKNPGWPGFCLALSFILISAPGMYTNFHNTKTVIFCSAVSLLAVLFAIVDDTPEWAIWGTILAILASMLRFFAFFLGAAFAFVPCAVTLFRILFTKYKGHIGDAIRMIAVFIVVLGLIFGLQYADGLLVSKNPDIGFYREYNQLRGVVSDYPLPDYYEYADKYRDMGITSNDIEMIDQWNFADLEKYDIETLQILSEFADSVSDRKGLFTSFLNSLGTAFTQDFSMAAALIFAVICLFVSNRDEFWALVLTPVMFIICVFLLCFTGRITRWVICGMSAAMLVTVLYSFNIAEKKFQKLTVCLTTVVCAIVCSLFALNRGVIKYRNAYREGLKETMEALADDPDNLYLLDIAVQPESERTQAPFAAFGRNLYKNVYPMGGWDTMSPAKNSVLERFDINPETESPYRKLIEKNNVFLADNKNIASKLTLIRDNWYPRSNASVTAVINGTFIWTFTGDNFNIDVPDMTETEEIAESEKAGNDETVTPTVTAPYPVIKEFSRYSDPLFESCVFYGLTADRSLPNYDRLFIEITSGSGTVNTYRMAAMEDYPETAQMRLPDIWSAGSITRIRLIVESKDGTVSSPYFEVNE